MTRRIHSCPANCHSPRIYTMGKGFFSLQVGTPSLSILDPYHYSNSSCNRTFNNFFMEILLSLCAAIGHECLKFSMRSHRRVAGKVPQWHLTACPCCITRALQFERLQTSQKRLDKGVLLGMSECVKQSEATVSLSQRAS